MTTTYKECDIVITEKDGKFQAFYKRTASQNGLNVLQEPLTLDENDQYVVASFNTEDEAVHAAKKAVDTFLGA